MSRWAVFLPRLAPLLLAAGVTIGAGGPQSTPNTPATPTLSGEAAIKRYCSGCHNERLKTAGLSLEGLDPAKIHGHEETWEKVIRRLQGRSMPPVPLPRPDESTYNSLVTTLENGLDSGAAAHPNPGRTDTFRRLTRLEYRNSIRDLLALDVDVSSLLPADEAGHGFDNVTVGDLSPTLLERYLSAARKISHLAVGVPPRSPGGVTINLPPDLTQEEHLNGLPLGTRGGTVVSHTFPLDAEYEIQIRLARDRNEHVEGLRGGTHEVELMLDGKRVSLFEVEPAKGPDHTMVDNHLKARLRVAAGPHDITVAFPKRPSLLLETERQPYQAHFNMDRHPRITPALYSVTINGPYNAQGVGDTPSRERIFTCRPSAAQDEAACAEKIFRTLLRRAYRRPVADRDLQGPMKFFSEARAKGFEPAIEMGLRSILISPEFLFRVEQDPPGLTPGTPYRLSDLELATRLSFFLWSSIPDDELLDAAIAGKLSQPGVLEQHARRMLADPRSEVLATNFAGQWLHLRNLDAVFPDMRIFPDFDDNLRQAFRRETELFFESIMREDRSIIDLLRANYTFVNGRLARHYGIPNVYGSRYRRVTFESDSPRGGLLGHGSILTVTSYATRTSPVIRGKWILENLLGVTPPPPPPAVPALSEKKAAIKGLTMRERVAQHRENPACAGCHNLMDPVGFAVENYDAVGRWRTFEDTQPIDASGGLPDGSEFEGVAGLREALLKRPELIASTFTEKLLIYALGRGVEHYDGPAIRKIVRDSRKDDYRFSAFIAGIVNSTPFQFRRSQ